MWISPIFVESEASATSSSSSTTPIIQLPLSQETIAHKRKRRRRRRNATQNDGSLLQSTIIIEEETSHTTKLESGAASSSPTPTLIDELPSQEKITHKKKRKSRRRRKGNDDVSLLQSHVEEDVQHTTTIESNHKLVQTTEEIATKFHINNDESSNNTTTAASLTNESVTLGDEDDKCKTIATDVLQSQSNVPNVTDKLTAEESSVGSVKVSDKKQNNVKNKKKMTTPIKKPPNASKSTTTSSSTGKEGECLRRIKHEWKDAVKSGIAYDWINMKTIRNTNTSSSAYVRIGPFGKNLLRWHFSVAGPANSVYENGIYHGRVLLPKDYPASPPRVQIITPSGRFIPGHDICLSASSYHPETWTPRWTVLSLVDALRLHMLTTANEIGGVLASDEKRRQYAIESRSWKFPGIVNHERMVAENIFVSHSLQTDEDNNNDCEEKTDADESNIVNNAGASNELNSGEDLKGAKNNDIPSGGDITTDLPPSTEHVKDAPKRASVTKKSKKKKKSKDLKGENNDVTHTEEEAVVSSSHLATIHEKDASKPSSPNNTAKKRKKPNVTPALDTVEDSTHGTTKRAKEASNKRKSSKQKKNNKKKLTDIQVQAKEHDKHDILTIILKRLLVEMLKLPLRVLATMIRILDRLEKYMRAILDGI